MHCLVARQVHSMARLLLIDPHPASGKATARLLASDGYQVALASSAAEALGALLAREFDLILLDPMLPDMPGAEFLDRLCEEPDWAGLPILIIASGSFNRTLWRFSAADLREWMVKGGFSADELMETVRRHVREREIPILN